MDPHDGAGENGLWIHVLHINGILDENRKILRKMECKDILIQVFHSLSKDFDSINDALEVS